MSTMLEIVPRSRMNN